MGSRDRLEELRAKHSGQSVVDSAEPPRQKLERLREKSKRLTQNIEITGESRASRKLEEFGSGQLMAGQDLGTRIKAALAGQFTPNTEELAKILTSISPDIGITRTPEGDVIANNNATGEQVVINKKGLSTIDVVQALSIGGAMLPAAMSGSISAPILGKMAQVGGTSAATQAVIEGGQKLAGGDFDKTDIAIAGAGGAAFEGVFQGLARVFPLFRQAISSNGGTVTPAIREEFKQKAITEGVSPDEITDDVIMGIINPKGAAIEGEKEFGIGLTRGQRDASQGQLRREDDLLTGRAGNDAAQDVMLKNRDDVAQQARDASLNIQRGLGDDALVASQQEAGGIIKQGIQTAERESDALVRQSREEIGDAFLEPNAFKNLLKKTKDSVKGIEFPTHGKGTQLLMKDINKALDMYKKMPKNFTLKPLHVQRIEQVRRRLGAYIKSAEDSTDKRNMIVMKKTFDGFLDDAVKNALFAGDQEALNAMKQSRSLFSEYAKKFRANPGKTKSGRTIPDRAGNIVEDIIEANPTDVQVVNSIFGAGKTFGNQAGKSVASKMKGILGKDSQEWNAVRQAAFKRIIQTFPDGQTINGKQTLKFLNETKRKNPELLREVFSNKELELMKRFATQVARSQPAIERGMVNPSGSGLVVNEGLKKLTSKLTEAIGWASGNPLLIAAGRGVQTGKGEAVRSVRPFEKIINAKPAPTALSTGAARVGIEGREE